MSESMGPVCGNCVAQAVKLYQLGVPVRECGVPRGTLYRALEKAGILPAAPKRKPRSRAKQNMFNFQYNFDGFPN
jgi:hypothetical protein